MLKEKKKKPGINEFSEELKEVSVRKHYTKPKPPTLTMEATGFLYCDPPEVILQNVEKNKLYQVPVRIHNISTTTKRVNIKHPKKNLFTVDTDQKNKFSTIAPGMHLEMLIYFDSDQTLLEDHFDQIVIKSENDFKLILELKAYIPQPLVQYEPLLNLGFVPVNTKKIETVQFLNEGAIETKIELRMDPKNPELKIEPDTFILPMSNPKLSEDQRRKSVTVTFEPLDTQNLHDRVEVRQITGDKPAKELGYIEIIATSVLQQMSIVFEEGGGPQTDINFGLLYFGQSKDCSAFLVNNGPREIAYKFFFHPNKSRKDVNMNFDDNDFACTPEQAGLEMTQRILAAEPLSGLVQPYSQVPVRFICKTKIKERHKGWNVTLCPEYDMINQDKGKNLRVKLNSTESYQSVAAIKFEEAFVNRVSAKETEDDFCKPISVFMEVKALLPDLTIDKSMLNFWECKLNKEKVIEITITNKNEDLPIDFSFNRISHFTISPSSGIINPANHNLMNTVTVRVIFHPKNIGSFSDVLLMKYVNDMYEIPIKVLGVCKDMDKLTHAKTLLKEITTQSQFPMIKPNKEDLDDQQLDDDSTLAKKKGDPEIIPDELALDFTAPKRPMTDQNTKIKRLHDDRLKEVIEKINRTDQLLGVYGKPKIPNSEHIKNFEDNFKIYKDIFDHKQQSNSNVYAYKKSKLEDGLNKKYEHLPLDGGNIDPSGKILIDTLSELPGNRLNSPRIRLQEPKDNLWVVKPIGKYEPVYYEENIKKVIGLNNQEIPEMPEDVGKGPKTGEEPMTHQEKRECAMQLSGEDLQKIQVSDPDLKMGAVFKNSEKSLPFWVVNNYRNHIFVKFEFDNTPDLSRSTPKSHVIAPGERQMFKITVYSTFVRTNVTYPVKYTINYKHPFKIKVHADIILVKLDLLTTLNKFSFKNDKLDKDRVEMSVTQKYRLYNSGNAPATIRWEKNNEKGFKIIPMTAIIPKNTEHVTDIIFNPFESAFQQRDKYTDELKINIENGEPVKFNVEGIVQYCKVSFVNLPNDTIDFGLIHTGKPNSKTFLLKNETNRVITAYQIESYFPGLSFKEQQGYLAEKVRTIEVVLEIKDPNPAFEANVTILIRGGNKLNLKITANIVQPEVFIVQEIFDFGGVSFNEPTTKTLTFQNNDTLSAEVIVNLNSVPYLKDFKLVCPEKLKQEKGHLIRQLIKEKKEEFIEDLEDEEEDEDNPDEGKDEDTNQTDLREFIVEIPPRDTFDFDFIFCPNNFETQSYRLETNFKLVGAPDDYKGMRRKIIAEKTDSIISISTLLVKFPKTFIYGNEKPFNNIRDIKIGSVQHNMSLKWEFILTEEFIKEGVFTVQDKKGEILAHQDQFSTLRFLFTPQTQKEYKSTVILQITDSDGIVTNKTIRLEGEGTLPRLYFDKREILLPIVPIGFESSVKFKVKNEGYDSEQISADFENYPQGILPLVHVFSESNTTIGFLKPELKCEVIFRPTKPCTFTTKLIFKDKEGKQFPIWVAGTCDNCMFTNFSFFQRGDSDSIEFQIDKETNSININKLFQNDTEFDLLEEDKKSEKNSSSFQGSSYTKNSVNNIKSEMSDLNCKYLKHYIKNIHIDDKYKQNSTSQFKVFPDDIVKDNGEILYMIIQNFTGKDLRPKNLVYDYDITKKAIQMRDQYYNVVKFLQESGCCLNTVFPEYLLDFNLWKRFIATDETRYKILPTGWDKAKRLPAQWRSIHRESWVLLIYQIIKVFYLARVNLKTYQAAIKHLPQEINTRHSVLKFGQSNVYSQSELILLKWITALFEHVNPNAIPKEPKTFSADFADSSLLSALILSYFPQEAERQVSKKNKQANDQVKIILYPNILAVLKSYGIFTHMKQKNLVKMASAHPNAREMILFLTMLYQNLQHFFPKMTIQFSCILGDSVVKAIYLLNNTIKTLEYNIKPDGSECFIHPGITEITIEPGKDKEYPITFKSKLSTPVEGKVYFLNKKSGWSSQAAPIVYNLISNVFGRRPIDTLCISSPLYTLLTYRLQVKLPLAKDKGEFEVRLEQRKKISQVVKNKNKKVVNPKNPTTELNYRVFFFKGEEENNVYKVRFNNADLTAEVPICFIPVEMDVYECDVIFTRETAGEFEYRIEGHVDKPQPSKLETFDLWCYVDKLEEFDLELKLANNYLSKAVNDYIKPLEVAGKKASMKAIANMLLPSTERIVFNVDANKPFLNVPPLIDTSTTTEPVKEKPPAAVGGVVNKTSTSDVLNTSGTGQINISVARTDVFWLKVKFSSKQCMVFEGDVTLTNRDKPHDIRVYRLFIDVKPKVIRATLEFFCPLKESIVQKIPIDNKSDKDWTIKGELTQTGTYFKHEPEKRIPKKQLVEYNLSFSPTEKINCTGTLKLSNSTTQETYYYTLVGNVEDPLAEGNIDIKDINAKDTQIRKITIENPTEREINYTVETDLDEIIGGVSSFHVPALGSYQYEMKIRPLLGKIYFGRIIFRDDKKNYKWYTIRVEAKSIVQSQSIEMRTRIRKVVYIELNLDNPTAEPAVFKIDFDSDLFLFGDREIKIEGMSSKVFQLLFAPLKVGMWDNVRLHIYNEKIGEFLYRLRLISEEQPPINCGLVKAELGTYVDKAITLENPTYEEIEVKAYNSNRGLFQILQEKIILPSGVNTEILIRYTPSTLEGEEECVLRFETTRIGKWEFHLRGKGIPPTCMKPTVISTDVGVITSGQLNFKNPLNEKITFTVDLRCDEWPGTFTLLNKLDKYSLDPLRTLIIRFTFLPKKLTKYYAEIYVNISKTLFWKYPIEGITEVKSKGIDFHFKTKAKKILDKIEELDLSNLPDNELDFSKFRYSLKLKDEKYQALIQKCFHLNLPTKKQTDQPNNKILPLEIKFYPLRPFKTECEFILSIDSGGQWIYNIILEATEPDPDDVIHIKSSLGKQSFVAFRLQNIFTKDEKFIAYFSHDSTSEFSVTPREGTLDQSGRVGSQFIVCYLPVEYGKVKIGKLIIETDEVQWIFEVRGTHLDYRPPEVKSANILKMTKATMNRVQRSEIEAKDLKDRKRDHSRSRSKGKNRSTSRSRSKSPRTVISSAKSGVRKKLI